MYIYAIPLHVAVNIYQCKAEKQKVHSLVLQVILGGQFYLGKSEKAEKQKVHSLVWQV